MKNFSKTIASISLSLLTIGAFGQSPSKVYFSHNPSVKVVVKPIPKSNYIQGANRSSHHNVGGATYSGQLNYPQWDNLINSGSYQGSGADNGWGTQLINMHFTEADTGSHSYDKNYNLIHSFTVAYDSIWDWYSQSKLSPHTTTIISIDTMWAIVSFKNTSTKIDTIIFQGVKTVGGGYPSTTQIFSDTVFVGNPAQDTLIGQYFGDSLDQGYYIGVLPNYTTPLKSFAVNLKFYGPKADTFEVFYGFPKFSCSPYEYPYPSSVGIPLGSLKYANTFTTGWPFAFSNVFTEMPEGNGDAIWYGVVCGDTSSFYQQDAAIFASVTYAITTGVNNINESGLSIGQNYPNPFNKETTISYSITKSSDVTFSVYDITGRVITTNNYGNVAPGQYQVNLNANTFSPGIYFYTFNVNGSIVTNKMIVTQ